MQEKEFIMVVRCKLKIPSIRITGRHHFASLVMPNCYPRDRIFNLHLTTIKDSYNILQAESHWKAMVHMVHPNMLWWRIRTHFDKK